MEQKDVQPAAETEKEDEQISTDVAVNDEEGNTAEKSVEETNETSNNEEEHESNSENNSGNSTEAATVDTREISPNEEHQYCKIFNDSKENSNDEIVQTNNQEENVLETAQTESVTLNNESEKLSDSDKENISITDNSNANDIEKSANDYSEQDKGVESTDANKLNTSASESIGSNKEKENEETDDEFDPSLLCPEVTMDVDETEVETNNLDDRGSSPLLYEPLFSTLVDEMTGAEVMFDLTPEEEEIRRTTYGPNNPIKFSQIHCTACNIHLGSALDTQRNRFVHPLLKVLVCKNCFHFYTSGEFEKDEDGSELYCRWCGQGGQVICCSKCEFVFCKKCIRHNFGRKKVKFITESDDWDCFRCDPTQLKYLRALCAELFDYVRRELSQVAADDVAALSQDYSRCCGNSAKHKTDDKLSGAVPKKRKRRSSSDDPDYNPIAEEMFEPPKPTKPIILQPPKITVKPPPPPPPQTLPTTINTITTLAPSVQPQLIYIPHSTNPTIQLKSIANQIGQQIRYIRPMRGTLPRMAPPVVLRGIPSSVGIRFTSVAAPPPRFGNVVQMRGPVRLPPPLTVRPTIRPPMQRTVAHRMRPPLGVQMSVTKTNRSNLNTEWFEKTVRAAARVNSNLSYTLTQLNRTQDSATSVKDLAIVHNKLQEVLSNSINSLIQIRKSLHTDFVEGIKSVKVKPKPLHNQKSVQQAEDDDDVIFVESEQKDSLPTTATVTASTPPPLTTSYIKVRPISALQNLPSDCITLPDPLKLPPLNPISGKAGKPKMMLEELLTSNVPNGATKTLEQKNDDTEKPFVISNVTTVVEDKAENQVDKNEVVEKVEEPQVGKTVVMENLMHKLIEQNLLKYNVKTFPSPIVKRMQDMRVTIERNKELESRIRREFNVTDETLNHEC